MDLAATSRIISLQIQSVMHHSVSTHTIRGRLQQNGTPARCLFIRFPLTGNRRRLSCQWCNERRTWVTERNDFVVTDESRFCLHYHDGRIRFWRHREIVGSIGHEKVPTCGKPGLERPGRPRGERIVHQALVDSTVTRSTIRVDVGVVIVPQTISRHLAEANFKSKRPFRALPLTPEHRQLRLQWCQARSMWNVTDWQNVVFSDESRFVLGTDDNRVRVWRRPGERYNPPTLFYVTLPAQLV
ncbi:HTH_Tnp_Tc3_2 domain-containing protein [Trichonephila clavipes]|nr:HTH_Tnp_Tc3_2 domain-containing protein [Trichonephila clavipes]